jgi:hypothetical protein
MFMMATSATGALGARIGTVYLGNIGAASSRPIYDANNSTALPVPSPAPSTLATPSKDKSEHQEQHNGANRGVEDQVDDPRSQMKVKARHQTVTDKGADQTNDNITDHTEPSSSHNLSG